MLYGNEHSADEVFLGRDFSSGKNYSEKTAAEIDDEIRALIEQAYKDAKKILTDHMDRLHFVAQYLLGHESMDGDQFAAAMKEDATVEQLEQIAAEKAEQSRRDNEERAKAEAEARKQAAESTGLPPLEELLRDIESEDPEKEQEPSEPTALFTVRTEAWTCSRSDFMPAMKTALEVSSPTKARHLRPITRLFL